MPLPTSAFEADVGLSCACKYPFPTPKTFADTDIYTLSTDIHWSGSRMPRPQINPLETNDCDTGPEIKREKAG